MRENSMNPIAQDKILDEILNPKPSGK